MPETRAPSHVVLRGDPDRVSQFLDSKNVLIDGHFRLLSGRHTDKFFRFSTIASDPKALDAIAGWIAPEVEALDADGVLVPTTAGVGLGWTLSSSMGLPMHLVSLDDESRPCGVLGEPDLAGHRLLLLNDVVTTGQGLRRMGRLVKDRGATVAGAGWFLARSQTDIESQLGAPCISIAEWDLPSWDEDDCQACAAGIELELAVDLN